MGFLRDCIDVLLYASSLVWSPLTDYGSQRPFLPTTVDGVGLGPGSWPQFPAPNGPEDGDFICEYPSMGKQWTNCSTSTDRSCWLAGPDGAKFDIYTNYETDWPRGVVREYYLEVDKMPINGDGIENPEGKVFNNTYPGPWIRACWGDTIKVTVKNKLQYNGTTVHWHGLRQLGSPEMDGVNGITQCPITPGHNMTYTFNATQYGTSWAHSHYSLQYADGLVAPITIFGPSSAPYDEALDPILITDWNHRSAFQDWQMALVPVPDFPKMNSMLINGHGNYAGMFPRKKFTTVVQNGKKYLLRIINTSVDTTWAFSIDNHNFTVISSDFVPIVPYNTTNVTVGIGQRYHIVLDATPVLNGGGTISDTGDYWIRTIAVEGCKGFETGNEPGERQGVLRYNASSTVVPTTYRAPFSATCKDEPYELLTPVFNWSVPPVDIFSHGELDIGKVGEVGRPAKGDQFYWWKFGPNPLWLDFGNPSILNLGNKTWDKDYVVIDENVPADTWVYMAITAPASGTVDDTSFFPVAHPMHLHGHDFAIIAQGNDSSQITNATLKFDNPPRRDVALLPSGGYLIIAFKADNPGTWLFHCHIPWHASAGLALQILERQSDLQKIMTPDRLEDTNRVCAEWKQWFGNPNNHWANGTAPFQDDSGI